jgi:hypothetical protein
MLSFGLNAKLIICKKIHRKFDYQFCCSIFFPNYLRSSLHPNKTNRISNKMRVCTNAKGLLLRVIEVGARPYAGNSNHARDGKSSVKLELQIH